MTLSDEMDGLDWLHKTLPWPAIMDHSSDYWPSQHHFLFGILHTFCQTKQGMLFSKNISLDVKGNSNLKTFKLICRLNIFPLQR